MDEPNRLLEALRPPHVARVPLEPPVMGVTSSSRDQLQPGGRYGILRSVGRYWVLFKLHYYSVPIGLVLSPGLYTTVPGAPVLQRTEADPGSAAAAAFPCAMGHPGHPNVPLPLPLALAQVLRPNSFTAVHPANLSTPNFGAPLLFIQRLRPAELAAVGLPNATELLFFARGEGIVADPMQLEYEPDPRGATTQGALAGGQECVPGGVGGYGPVRVSPTVGGHWLAQDDHGMLVMGRAADRTLELAGRMAPDRELWLELPHKRRHMNPRPKLRRLTAVGTPPWHVSPREFNEVPAWL